MAGLCRVWFRPDLMQPRVGFQFGVNGETVSGPAERTWAPPFHTGRAPEMMTRFLVTACKRGLLQQFTGVRWVGR